MSVADDDVVLAGDEALHSALASIPGVSVIVFDHAMRIRALHGTALQRHAAHVADQDAGALGGERDRQRATEARRAPGDDDRAVGQPRHAGTVDAGRLRSAGIDL